MSYVAIKGGERAIEQAANLLEVLRTRGGSQGERPIELDAIEHQLHYLHSQVLSEGGLYDPELASLAIKQSLGDPLEAAFLLRAHRSTRPRIATTPVLDTSNMRLIRRISSAFKEIPGGQMLGPTPDYTHRLFNLELIDETPEAFQAVFGDWLKDIDMSASNELDRLPKVLDFLRDQGLVQPPPPEASGKSPGKGSASFPGGFDLTREALVFPVPRSAVLAGLTRGQQGSVMALAYSNMRGYGDVHPTIAELRVGYVPVMLPHPVTGELTEAGEVLVTECEVIAMFEQDDEAAGKRTGAGQTESIDLDAPPTFTLGYGACFGHNEAKAIGMAILDRSLQKGMRDGASNPSEDAEFVLLHVDGIDAMGFTVHYKMPHYVTFASDLDRLRQSQANQQGQKEPMMAEANEGGA